MDMRVQNIRGLAVHAANIHKRYGERSVLEDADLRIEPGEFITIVGRSGCGKSTLLRLLAGLEQPDAGQLLFDGETRAERQGDVRIMFQDARLLPWRRVVDNVALGLQRPRSWSRPMALLNRMKAEPFGAAPPDRVSCRGPLQTPMCGCSSSMPGVLRHSAPEPSLHASEIVPPGRVVTSSHSGSSGVPVSTDSRFPADSGAGGGVVL